MTVLIAYKSVLVMMVACAVVASLPRLKPAAKHALWLTALVALIALPFLHGLAMPFAPTGVLSFPPLVIAAAGTAAASASVWQAVWLAGVVLLATRLLVGAITLRQWLRGTVPSAELRRLVPVGIEVRVHPTLESPLVIGVVRPRIIVPVAAREWSAEVLRAAVAHELAHIARRDCVTQLFAQLVRAVFWFNPLVWLAEHELRRQRELACDAAALEEGVRASVYAEFLLSLRAPARLAFAAGMDGGGLHQRLAHMLSPRALLSRRWASGAFVAFVALSVIIGCGKTPRATIDAVSTEATEAPLEPTGTLDPSMIANQIREYRDLFRVCYERELQKTPSLAGTIRTRFIIGPDGHVTSSGVRGSTMGNTTVENCLAQVESQIVFPEPEGGGSVMVNYPFAFSPN